MKKMMKKNVAVVLSFVLMGLCLFGCGKKAEEPEIPDTMGGALMSTFLTEMKNGSSVEATVEALMAKTEMECGSMECEEGFLNGFSGEVTGFTSATMFAPFIGSIPFVGFVFETDDPKGLEENLKSLADPRWNICTEAEETVSAIYDNYVFFAMCPGEDF